MRILKTALKQSPGASAQSTGLLANDILHLSTKLFPETIFAQPNILQMLFKLLEKNK